MSAATRPLSNTFGSFAYSTNSSHHFLFVDSESQGRLITLARVGGLPPCPRLTVDGCLLNRIGFVLVRCSFACRSRWYGEQAESFSTCLLTTVLSSQQEHEKRRSRLAPDRADRRIVREQGHAIANLSFSRVIGPLASAVVSDISGLPQWAAPGTPLVRLYKPWPGRALENTIIVSWGPLRTCTTGRRDNVSINFSRPNPAGRLPDLSMATKRQPRAESPIIEESVMVAREKQQRTSKSVNAYA